ncbi:MAG: tRNA (adenosine(37)-N6)-threonylcarbamoyltransferase complex ATPase subunit type 1 TsaE [Flavobacteriales bacterium]|nr:tRNA (adenosine(37)-N6)-threonylcarbamoyltransferase complex ATPase subunit type 1 TsaE [Flavobacteriales bacterium]
MYQATFELEELSKIAAQVLQEKHHRIMLFEGEMGAGKTTLIKELSKQLGVSENTNSPTYLIVNQYQSDQGETLYHFDAYRLKEEEEAYAMGFDEYLDSGAYCFIEWPGRMGSIIPDEHTRIKIIKQEDGKRLITMS